MADAAQEEASQGDLDDGFRDVDARFVGAFDDPAPGAR